MLRRAKFRFGPLIILKKECDFVSDAELRRKERWQVEKDIMKLAWPSIVEQILVMLVGIVAMVLMGRIGTAALAAVGLVNMVMNFIQAVFNALSTGTTVVVARQWGEKDYDTIGHTLVQSIIISIVASAIIVIPCLFLKEPILRIFLGGNSADALALAVEYFGIILLGVPGFIIYLVVAGAFRGVGDTKTPMFVAAISNVLNIVLSLVLIFGWGPVKPMGIAGAGWANTISRWASMILILAMLKLSHGGISKARIRSFKVRFDLIRRIFKVGIPASLEQLVMQGGFLMMQTVIASMGTVALATYQVVTNINSMAFMPVTGLATAATAMVSQTLGAQDLRRADMAAWQNVYTGVAAVTFTGILLVVFANPLMHMYSSDPAVLQLGISCIYILALVEPFMGVNNVISAVLRGAGDITYVLITSFIGIWGFRLLTTLALYHWFNLGLQSVYYAFLADFGIRTLMYWIRLRKGKWKYIKV